MATIDMGEFDTGASNALRIAMTEPVIITDQGIPAFVLLSIADYRRLSSTTKPLSELLNHDESITIDADLPRANNE